MGSYGENTEERRERELRFTYHPPGEDQIARYGEIRDRAKAFAEVLAHVCPPSRELSLAMTMVEAAVMWANAAIARREAATEDACDAR